MIPACGRVWMHTRSAYLVDKHSGNSAVICPRSKSGHLVSSSSPIFYRV
jgi:hypothetical protein